MILIKIVKPVIKLAMPRKSIIHLKFFFYGLFFGIQNHEICIPFTYISTQIVLLHMASFSVKNKVESARNHQPCLNTVSWHQVIPRIKPGGRKKLCDGLEAVSGQSKFFMFEDFNICIDNVSILKYIFTINCRFGRWPESVFVSVC